MHARTGLQLTVKEQWIAPCHIDDLDNEMVGGLSAQGADQEKAIKEKKGKDSVRLKGKEGKGKERKGQGCEAVPA
eukprot:scaffold13188_cov21-Tisochrysis_lutea.AAC.1